MKITLRLRYCKVPLWRPSGDRPAAGSRSRGCSTGGRPEIYSGNAVPLTGSGSSSTNRRHKAINWAAGSCRARWHNCS